MAAITIRNVDPELKRQLRIRAASSGRSMEEEARNILRAELASQTPEDQADLYQRIRRHIDPIGGADLPQISRHDHPGHECRVRDHPRRARRGGRVVVCLPAAIGALRDHSDASRVALRP